MWQSVLRQLIKWYKWHFTFVSHLRQEGNFSSSLSTKRVTTRIRSCASLDDLPTECQFVDVCSKYQLSRSLGQNFQEGSSKSAMWVYYDAEMGLMTSPGFGVAFQVIWGGSARFGALEKVTQIKATQIKASTGRVNQKYVYSSFMVKIRINWGSFRLFWFSLCWG